MKIIRDYQATPENAKGCALAIGNFDGIHLGHRAVIEAMLEESRRRNVPSAVMCFEPHPRRFFGRDVEPFMLEPFHVKARRLLQMGVDYIFVIRFNHEFAAMDAEHFTKEVLCDAIAVSHVVTGDNFIFGHKRSGDISYLEQQSLVGRFGFTAVKAVKAKTGEREMTCSSSRIRQFLKDGQIADANALLGRSYEMVGRVRTGDKRGRVIGFPTANIEPSSKIFSPAYGVYAVRFLLADKLEYETNILSCAGDNRWYYGVANFGLRPTFGGDESPRLEVNGFNIPQAERGMYGRIMRVKWLYHIRNEQVFDGVEQLKKQILIDAKAAEKWLNAN